MSKPTVHDIAREAGVSLATVDRVINARPGVREKTVAKVQEAIGRLGYVRDTYAANLARKKEYRFGYVLPEGPSAFVDALRDAIQEADASQLMDRTALTTIQVPFHDPHAIVAALRPLAGSGLDGVALMVPETPQVRDAVARMKDAGLAIVAMVSDLPNTRRDHFIGVNSVAAGRTAGLLMGRFTLGEGEILVVSNSLRSRDSLERRLGFDQVLAHDFPKLRALPSIEALDNVDRMTGIIESAFADRPALAGIYSMESGNAVVVDAMRRCRRRQDLVVIAHELTPVTREGLFTGDVSAVITQNVGHLARSSLRVLRNLCDGAPIFDAQERIRIEIVLRENLH
ncbi:MAG: LacI family DNA-binding transcriptional regulator [Pseudomonadota bacterium]